MLKNLINAFGLAIQNIRSNMFHTFLSVLGIVIGVAALVSILSFIDGLEKFAQEQITQNTSISTVKVSTEEYRQAGDIRLKKDTFAILDHAAFLGLVDSIDGISKAVLSLRMPPMEIGIDTCTKPLGAMPQAVDMRNPEASEMAAGRPLSEADVATKQPVAVINDYLAAQAVGKEHVAALVGKSLRVKGRELSIVGIVKSKDKEKQPKVLFPLTLLSPAELQASPPVCFIESAAVEKVPQLKTAIENNLKRRYPARHSDFEVVTNEFYVEQAAKGFLLFRVVMGMIVGISILVGGIGVMNVLLISVKERTSEIGIRKAVGAKQRDIRQLFLAESITVSMFGSFLGLIVGVLATMVIIPIIKMLTDLPFEAAYTWNTFFTITVIAVLIGVVFGTYPAMKAARLDPVEAIRRE